jgi:hypothetical protein
MPKRQKKKRLSDSYQFPGFRPATTVGGLFGDRHARVVRLNRRSKKRSAEYVAWSPVAGTTRRADGSGTYLVAEPGFTSSWTCDAWSAGAAEA